MKKELTPLQSASQRTLKVAGKALPFGGNNDISLRRKGAALITTGALALTGVMGEKAVNTVENYVHGNNVEAMIIKAGPNALTEVEKGKIDPKDVDVIPAPSGGPTAQVAAEITKPGTNYLINQSQLLAEVGDTVSTGEPLVLHEGNIKPEFDRPLNLPDDPNTHVG